MSFTQTEVEYLTSQRLGRVATVAPDGQPQVSPTSFHYNAELGTIDIGGRQMGDTKRFRNVAAGSDRVAFVVDDVASVEPWRVRGIEVRGDAEALTDQEPYLPGFSREIVRLRPRRVISWGVEDQDQYQAHARDVEARA